MIIGDLTKIGGRTCPARCKTLNLVGGESPIQTLDFSMGFVTLESQGRQVPCHNQYWEEICFVLEGEGGMCLGEECCTLESGQAVFIPCEIFPSYQRGRYGFKNDLLLRSRRGGGSLAPGTRRHAAQSRCRRSALLPEGARLQHR